MDTTSSSSPGTVTLPHPHGSWSFDRGRREEAGSKPLPACRPVLTRSAQRADLSLPVDILERHQVVFEEILTRIPPDHGLRRAVNVVRENEPDLGSIRIVRVRLRGQASGVYDALYVHNIYLHFLRSPRGWEVEHSDHL